MVPQPHLDKDNMVMMQSDQVNFSTTAADITGKDFNPLAGETGGCKIFCRFALGLPCAGLCVNNRIFAFCFFRIHD